MTGTTSFTSGNNAYPARTADSITVLHETRGARLTKQVTATKVEPAENGWLFDVETVAIAGLDALKTLLLRIAPKASTIVIRGALIDPARTKNIRRLMHGGGGIGTPLPRFREQPRCWVMVDADGIIPPPGLDLHDLTACGRYAAQQLPRPFHAARCLVQASASHGINGKLRLHLWFWLSRPTSSDELKRWITTPGIDPAVFNGVQIHYTANPVFDGVADHLSIRLVDVPGAEVVQVPSPSALAPPPPPPRPVIQRGVHPTTAVSEDRARAFIDAALDRVRNSEGHKHKTLYKESYTLGGVAEQLGLDNDEIETWLLDALPATVESWPAARRTIREGLKRGRRRPLVLNMPGDEFEKINSPTQPPFPLPTATPVDVWAQTLRAERTFFAERHRTPPLRRLVIAPTGSQKTRNVPRLLRAVIDQDLADNQQALLDSDEPLAGKIHVPHRWIVLVNRKRSSNALV
jgi:hypothetical protein